MSTRGLRQVLLVAALAIAGAGCNHVEQLSFAPSPATAPPPPTTVAATLPDGAGIQLAPVAGSSTTTTPSLRGGRATISGTVLGPLGAVAGATVLAERVVGTAISSITAITDPDGSFSLSGLPGGHYRLRAWQAPTLALVTPDIFFLKNGGLQSLSLVLMSYATPGVVGVVNPDPPVAGQPANLAVQVTKPIVGPDGVVRNPPLAAAAVTLTDGPTWDILSHQNPVRTLGNGEAIFEVRCTTPGDQPLDASVNGLAPVDLQVPSCAAP